MLSLLLSGLVLTAAPASVVSLLDSGERLSVVGSTAAATDGSVTEGAPTPNHLLPVQLGASLLTGLAFGFGGYWAGFFIGYYLDLPYMGSMLVIGTLAASLGATLGVLVSSNLLKAQGRWGGALLGALLGAVPSLLVAASPWSSSGPFFVAGVVAGAVLPVAGALLGFHQPWMPRQGLAVMPTFVPSRNGVTLGLTAAW